MKNYFKFVIIHIRLLSAAMMLLVLAGCGSTPAPPIAQSESSTAATASTLTPTAEPAALTATATPSPAPTESVEPTEAIEATTPSTTPTVSPAPTEPVEPTEPPSTPTRPLPTSTPPPVGQVLVYTTSLTLPTYPYQEYLVEQIDPVYNMPVYYFNRPQFELDAPTPEPVTYTGVVLENPYLRLMFLPELGGRLYSARLQPYSQELFYHNPVIKPSRYGVLQPYEANWWLASGGLEWAYPVQEHGYRFGVPWTYSVAQNNTGATITLSDSAPDRVSLSVRVTLPISRAGFTVQPTLTNNSDQTAPVQLWSNAALALSSRSMSPDTQFIIPTEAITIHSRGEAGWNMPIAGMTAPWPQAGGVDLRRYRQWANYLGFFVADADVPFIAAYNPETRLAMARLPTQSTPTGSGKLFAFGSGFTDRSYTNDDSQYFELWGGANAGFWPEDDLPVAPGESLGWQEQWRPLAGLPGLTWVTADAAIHLDSADDNSLTLTALPAYPTQAVVQAQTANGEILLDETITATPTEPRSWQFTATERPLTITINNSSGQNLLSYRFD